MVWWGMLASDEIGRTTARCSGNGLWCCHDRERKDYRARELVETTKRLPPNPTLVPRGRFARPGRWRERRPTEPPAQWREALPACSFCAQQPAVPAPCPGAPHSARPCSPHAARPLSACGAHGSSAGARAEREQRCDSDRRACEEPAEQRRLSSARRLPRVEERPPRGARMRVGGRTCAEEGVSEGGGARSDPGRGASHRTEPAPTSRTSNSAISSPSRT